MPIRAGAQGCDWRDALIVRMLWALDSSFIGQIEAADHPIDQSAIKSWNGDTRGTGAADHEKHGGH
jgi:hypothetical protein